MLYRSVVFQVARIVLTSSIILLASSRPEASTTEQDDEDLEGTANNLAELIALRKLRQSTRKEGIDLEKLNSVNRDKKRKKKKAEDPLDSYGLQPTGGRAAKDDR